MSRPRTPGDEPDSARTARRQLDPRKGPVTAFAWALARLREKSGLSLSQMSQVTHFDKGTLSRVTNGETLPPRRHLDSFVQACGAEVVEWEQLRRLAERAVLDGPGTDAPMEFARELTQWCASKLPDHSSKLDSAELLAEAWRGSTRQTVSNGAGAPYVTARPGSDSGQAGPQEPPPTASPQPSTPVSRPRARVNQRTIAVGAVGCAVLAGVGFGSYFLGSGTADTGAGRGAAGVGSTASQEKAEEASDDSRERLEDARKGGVWVIGVKRSQPGLSECETGGDECESEGEDEGEVKNWSGAEVEYAKALMADLGISNYRFKGVGTNEREAALEQDRVDMIIGTYGISSTREKEVDFAGPYIKTQQGVMLEGNPGGESNEARIKGDGIVVNSVADVPEDARVCVVDGSTGMNYVQDQTEFKSVKKRTDYQECVDGLRGATGKDPAVYDMVLTDAPILKGFEKTYPNAKGNVIASVPNEGLEEYGVGLKEGSVYLRKELCRAMRKNKVIEARQDAYGDIVEESEFTKADEMYKCS